MPSYTYTTNIPAGTDNPSDSQPDMQVNCSSINSIVNVDMIGFNDANGGYHSKVTLVSQGANPATVAGTGILFTKTVTGLAQLFYKDSAGTVIQLSNTASNPLTQSGATSFVNVGATQVVSFATSFSTVLSVVIYPGNAFAAINSGSTYISAIANGNFTITMGATGSWVFYYIATGYA